MRSSLTDLFSHPDIVPLVCIVMMFACGLIGYLTRQWRLHRKTEIETGLKRAMIEKGMSAAEIERVMRASLTSSQSGREAGGSIEDH
ncbi:MAG TPA: hypothetical protein PKD86_16775 [Gemmatales bacterium]|nr:hypothetical protein [Gemmatales bacterium]HMP61000.1 hypothetical protein [Gemmatales bacterium]